MGTRLLALFPWNNTNRNKVYIKMVLNVNYHFEIITITIKEGVNKQAPTPHPQLLKMYICIYYFFRTCIQG